MRSAPKAKKTTVASATPGEKSLRLSANISHRNSA
jgi:hypothetical protein